MFLFGVVLVFWFVFAGCGLAIFFRYCLFCPSFGSSPIQEIGIGQHLRRVRV